VSAERLHNIKTKKGFTYGGKDDPVLLSLAQGDWPAPGEITSPWAACPMVAGDCRGSHHLHILPVPINSQTSYWSGPILSCITLSCNIHTGRIGAISDQFALGTPWDEVRRRASELAIQFRTAHGIKQPATLHEDELEYQEGWKERRARLEHEFELKPPLTFSGNGNGHGASGRVGERTAAGRSARTEEID
jgi:fructose 1,6-bisphosphate aldolase/phosphatase